MNLASLLNRDQVLSTMEASEHWEAIEELVGTLHEHGYLSDAQKPPVLEALKEREEKISTGIGHGVAIPHAFSDEVEEVVAMFGRSKEGIDFEALDNAPVYFVILFVVPRKQYQLHLKTLSAIAKLFTNRKVRERLTDAQSVDEILAIFAKRPARSS